MHRMCLCQGDLKIQLLSLGKLHWAWGSAWSLQTVLCLEAPGSASVSLQLPCLVIS